MLYNVQGEYGKVRSIMHLPSATARSLLCFSTSAGWHQCNDMYHISRDDGLDDYLVFFTICGNGHLRLGDSEYPLTENSIAIVPAGVNHEYYVQPQETWEFYWVHVNGLAAAPLLDHIVSQHGVLLQTGAPNQHIYREIEDLIAYKCIDKPTYEVYASVILTSILHEIFMCLQKNEPSTLGGAYAVRELVKYLETNFNQQISIKGVCQSFYISAGHLTRVFRAKIGYTPYEYLLRYRIIKSKELLLYTDSTIKEIAQMTGFCSASNFISKFKATESLTPEQFRKSTRESITLPPGM